MKRSLIALAAMAAAGASAGWSRNTAEALRGHELRAMNIGGLFADNDDPTDADLAGLSEEERAALKDTTTDEDTLRAIAEKPGPTEAPAPEKTTTAQAGDGTDEDDDGDDTVDGGETVPPAATPAPTAAPAAAATEPAPAPAPVQEPVVYAVTAPEDAEEQIKAKRAEKAAAFQKLMDGDISPEEYSAIEDRVLGEISGIERQLTKAETAAEITTQNAQRSWLQRVNLLIDNAKKNDGVDYRGQPELHEQLDRTVKWLANDPANADKPEQWFLDEAHAMVKARNGITKPTTAGAPPAPPASRSGTAPALDKLPPNIARQPPAADSDDGGEFSHLRNLTGMDLERAVARMTPEQQERWAQES